MRRLIILTTAFLFLAIGTEAQRDVTIQYLNANVSEDIRESDVEKVVNSIRERLESYLEFGQLGNQNNEIDFKLLFDYNANIVNDFELNGNNEIISLNQYANALREIYASQAFKFSLEDISLESLRFDEDYVYEAKVNAIKRLEQIAVNGELVNSPDAYVEMQFIFKTDQDEFLSEINAISGEMKGAILNRQSSIAEVEPEKPREKVKKKKEKAPKVKKEKVRGFKNITRELAVSYSFTPSNNLTNLTAGTINSFSSTLQPKWSSALGIDVTYRNSLNRNRTLFWHVGLQVSSVKIATSITGYSPDKTSPDRRLQSDLSENEYIPYFESSTSGSISSGDADAYHFYILNLAGGSEELTMTTYSPKIGISYQFWKSPSDVIRLLADFSLMGTFIPNVSGDLVGTEQSLKVPVENFLAEEDWTNTIISSSLEDLSFDQIIIDEYKFNNTIENSNIEPEANTIFGLAISPSILYNPTTSIGVELGLQYYLSLNNIFENRSTSSLTEQYLLNPGRVESVIEDYYQGSAKLSNLSFRIGINIKL